MIGQLHRLRAALLEQNAISSQVGAVELLEIASVHVLGVVEHVRVDIERHAACAELHDVAQRHQRTLHRARAAAHIRRQQRVALHFDEASDEQLHQLDRHLRMEHRHGSWLGFGFGLALGRGSTSFAGFLVVALAVLRSLLLVEHGLRLTARIQEFCLVGSDGFLIFSLLLQLLDELLRCFE